MVNNLDSLADLTSKIEERFARLETAKEKEKDSIKKEILELQKKRGELIGKLKTEILKAN